MRRVPLAASNTVKHCLGKLLMIFLMNKNNKINNTVLLRKVQSLFRNKFDQNRSINKDMRGCVRQVTFWSLLGLSSAELVRA